MTSHNRHEQTSCAGVSTDPCCLQSELSELLGSPNQDCVSQAECWVKKLEMTFSENYSWSDLAAQFCLWYSKKIQLSRTRLSWVWLHFSCPTRHSFQVISSKFDARGPDGLLSTWIAILIILSKENTLVCFFCCWFCLFCFLSEIELEEQLLLCLNDVTQIAPLLVQ